MDQAASVNLDLERGREIVDALDRTNLKVAVALWAILPEYEDWRLVLAARQFDALDIRSAYRLVTMRWRLLEYRSSIPRP